MDEKEYRERLIAINEDGATKLPKDQWYDRIRYLREIIGMEALKSYQMNPTVPQEYKKAPRPSHKATKVYKEWMND